MNVYGLKKELNALAFYFIYLSSDDSSVLHLIIKKLF